MKMESLSSSSWHGDSGGGNGGRTGDNGVRARASVAAGEGVEVGASVGVGVCTPIRIPRTPRKRLVKQVDVDDGNDVSDVPILLPLGCSTASMPLKVMVPAPSSPIPPSSLPPPSSSPRGHFTNDHTLLPIVASTTDANIATTVTTSASTNASTNISASANITDTSANASVHVTVPTRRMFYKPRNNRHNHHHHNAIFNQQPHPDEQHQQEDEDLSFDEAEASFIDSPFKPQ